MVSLVDPSIPPLHPPHLEDLFRRHRLDDAAVRTRFAALWAAHVRHAPLFGTADHPDLDPETLDAVRDAACAELAAHAVEGRHDAVRQAAVRQLVRAMRTAGGLPGHALDAGLLAALRPASRELAEALGAAHVPLIETFAAHRSLVRHYDVHRDALAELIRWTAATLTEPELPRWAQRFVDDIRRAPLPGRHHPSKPTPRPTPEPPTARGLDRLGDPPCPAALAALASAGAPWIDAEPGTGGPIAEQWAQVLAARLDKAGIAAVGLAEQGEEKALPGLVESALLVHLLGLEDRRHKAVLADAADRVLMHHLLPMARAVGGRNNRHEPVAAYLVSVIARALRPWSFEAPRLSPAQRVLLLTLLAELGTSKARKLLHQEKKHADRQSAPGLIKAAVNRSLTRLPERQRALSPRQRIDRVAAGLRYLNRVRRGTDPRARDVAIVGELLG